KAGLGRGGGIYKKAGTATVENSTFLGNLARGGSNNIRTGALVGPAGGAGIFNADGAILFLSGSTFTGNQAIGGSNNTSTGGNGGGGFASRGGLGHVGGETITASTVGEKQGPGGHRKRGDLPSFQFVGTAMGGAIFTFAGNTSGGPVSLTLSNVTLRRNQAVGGDDNTAGTFMNAGVGGGLVNIATNDFVTPSGGSTT